jgi:hypothetical protein
MPANEKIEIQNINCPGRTSNVNAQKYTAMKRVLLKVIPKKPPGLTQKEMQKAILPHLPEDLWPGGQKSAWWAKTVQLDLEAKEIIVRTDSKPLTWHKV